MGLTSLETSLKNFLSEIEVTKTGNQPPSFKLDYITHIPNLIFLDNNQISLNNTDPTIYTDGSEMDSGTAFAFVVYHNQEYIYSQSNRLNNNSIFQAELLAIASAIDWAISSSFTIMILTDNQSSFLSLQQFFSSNSISYNIISKIKSHTRLLFNIGWIKGHHNIEGNDKADALAKSPKFSMCQFPLPISHLKNLLKIKLLKDWETLRTEDSAGLYTFNFIQKPTFLQSDDQVLFYFLSGHDSFPT